MSDDQREEEKTGILSSVSLTTVIASALAAGTSLVLSSKIGLAGSVIGTVVAAAASSFATQIYQSILKKSAEKVRDVTNMTADLGSAGDDNAAANGEATSQPHDGMTVVQRRPVTLSDKTGPQERAETGTPIAPQSIRYAAHARESKAATRRAFVVAIATALVALAVTAGIITLATAGQGLGTTTAFAPAATAPADTVDADQQAADADQTTDTDATQTDQQSGQTGTSDSTVNGTTGNGGTSSGTTSDADASTDSNSSSSGGDAANGAGGTTGGATTDGGASDNTPSGDSASGADTTDGTATAQ